MTRTTQLTAAKMSTVSFIPGMCFNTSTNTPDTLSLSISQTPPTAHPPPYSPPETATTAAQAPRQHPIELTQKYKEARHYHNPHAPSDKQAFRPHEPGFGKPNAPAVFEHDVTPRALTRDSPGRGRK